MEIENIKQQNLVEDVKGLQKQTRNVENKLLSTENDVKNEKQKKNLYEVKIAEFKKNIEYYTATSEKLGVRLQAANRVQSQFEIASECYEKMLTELTENYIEYNKYKTDEQRGDDDLPQSNCDLQQQVSNKLDETSNNFKLIDILMSELNVQDVN